MLANKTKTSANKVLPKAGAEGIRLGACAQFKISYRLNFLLKIAAFGKPRNVRGNFKPQ
jgi:hypothetical protein